MTGTAEPRTTEPLWRARPMAKTAPGRVVAHTAEGGVVLDRSLFFPRGGGQPGDSGRLVWSAGRMEVATAVPGEGGAVVLLPAGAGALPPEGAEVEQQIDWDRRWGHARIHTALHLLSVVLPYPVTGGAIAADRGRLDFAMGELPEPREVVQGRLNTLVDRDLPVSEDWIEETALDANPGLVKTLTVAPPRGQGPIRLVRIGDGMDMVDLQPCGGTHVARTAQIGRLEIAKVENKGARNRRVAIRLAT